MIIYVQSLEGVEVICEFWIVSLDHRDVSFWMYVIVCTSKITFFFFIVHLRYFIFFSRKKKRREKGKKKELRNSGFPLSGFVIFSPQCSIRFFSRGRNITRKGVGRKEVFTLYFLEAPLLPYRKCFSRSWRSNCDLSDIFSAVKHKLNCHDR